MLTPSKNKLLGSGVPEEEIIEVPSIPTGKPPIWMYHIDVPEGKIFYSVDELQEAVKNGWVDTPAKFK